VIVTSDTDSFEFYFEVFKLKVTATLPLHEAKTLILTVAMITPHSK